MKLNKKIILNFVKSKIKKGEYPSRRYIEKLFHIDIRNYFKNNIEGLYNSLGIDYKPIKKRIIENRIRLAMQKRRRFKTKEEGRKIICNYVKNKVKKRVYPGYSEIRKRFKINTKSYFKGLREVYTLLGIEYKRRRDKTVLRNQILNYLSENIKKSIHPSKKDIEKKFGIHLYTYFPKGIKELSQIFKGKYKVKRKPRINKDKVRRGIIYFTKKSIKKGIYPGYREISEKFNINLDTYFPNVKSVYQSLGIEYKKDPNPLISIEKQEKLRKISIEIFKKLGYKIIKEKTINEDILIKDKDGNIIPVELKAYRKNLSLPNRLPYINKIIIKNEIGQLRNYMNNYNSRYGILITTTNKIKIPIPKNIILLKSEDIRNYLQKFNLQKFIKDLEWIRNVYTSENKTIKINQKRNEIIKFIKKNYKKGRPIISEIHKRFNIDYRTYFPNGVKEIYKL